jgi:histidyl-tRNA synthetase
LYGVLDTTKIIFTPTLARGLDYYTGIIFEVKLTECDMLCSVSGGGRYDNLLSRGRKQTPLIGFSFGIDRLLPYVVLPEKKACVKKIWVSTIEKFDNAIEIKLRIVGQLIAKNYSVYYDLNTRKFGKELREAIVCGCSYIVIVGETEAKNNMALIKDIKNKTQASVSIDDVCDYIDANYC